MKLGKTIKMCRVCRGMNQDELSALSGLSVGYVSLIENEKRKVNIESLEAISRALLIPISILVFLASEDDELVGVGDELADKIRALSMKLLTE